MIVLLISVMSIHFVIIINCVTHRVYALSVIIIMYVLEFDDDIVLWWQETKRQPSPTPVSSGESTDSIVHRLQKIYPQAPNELIKDIVVA